MHELISFNVGEKMKWDGHNRNDIWKTHGGLWHFASKYFLCELEINQQMKDTLYSSHCSYFGHF